MEPVERAPLPAALDFVLASAFDFFLAVVTLFLHF
jgi:hypothetical protein